MATFDTLIDDLATRFGLGANARTLVKEVLAMISGSPGGLGGLLDRFKSAGLTTDVASWLARPDASPIAAGQIEHTLGAAALSGIAGRLGLTQGAASTALGYALPKIVGLLTPGGAVPAGIPAEVTAFLSQPAEQVAPDRIDVYSVSAHSAQPRAAAVVEQVAPKRNDVLPASTENESGIRRWLWPALAALVVVGLLSYFWSTLNRTPPASPVASTPEPATPPPATIAQAPPPPPPSPAPPPAVPAPSTDAQATAPQPSPPPAAQAPAAPVSPPATEQAATTSAPAAVAAAEPTAPASAAMPTRLALSNDNGVVRASGVVRDQDAKTSIIDTLKAVFGADKVKSDISVDPSAIAAPWFGKFRAALETIKGANVDAIFQGDKIDVGGASMVDAARDKIIAALKSAVGAGVAVGALTDQTAAATASTAPSAAAPAAVAAAEPTAPAPAPAAAPARFALSNDNGVVRASGVVRDQDAKTSITDALNAVFGADKVKSDISVDMSATAAPWLGAFRAALEAIKGANVDAIFEGDKINVGGAAMGDAVRDKIIAALKSAVGAGVTVGALTDKTAAAVAVANDRATTELASLGSGFAVKDLLFALNDSTVNFASDSAEVPESTAPFLRTAAADLKQLKAGHVLEIAGYTDSTGDAALNLALSQKRAEAVREALIKYGADADMLVAKGYGDANPIANNDTAEGRLKNRRIEYHVVKAPT
jgi:OmpA-OmpF porin, OOP family